ncbi:hypothetical protein JXI42_04310 [bacterium]|nr:hypothetical protein [bacterium]
MKGRTASIAVFWVMIILFFYLFHPLECAELSRTRLREAIPRGVEFLKTNQMNHGEFKTYRAHDESLTVNLVYDASPFVTTFVTYSISFVDNPVVKNITGKALAFFLKEGEPPGLWRFWTSRSGKSIDPDLDDISCISFLLEQNDIPMKSIVPTVIGNRNEQGLFNTWVRDSGQKNDLDCVVNANVLLFLGDREETIPVCEYLNEIIIEGNMNDCFRYYLDDMAFYYMVSRAYFNGASCLEESREDLIEQVVKRQLENGSFGDELQTAFALCALLNCDYKEHQVLDEAVVYLLDTQDTTGSWRKIAFFTGLEHPAPQTVWWGSEEMTTAICVEALARFSTMINGFEKVEEKNK